MAAAAAALASYAVIHTTEVVIDGDHVAAAAAVISTIIFARSALAFAHACVEANGVDAAAVSIAVVPEFIDNYCSWCWNF